MELVNDRYWPFAVRLLSGYLIAIVAVPPQVGGSAATEQFRAIQRSIFAPHFLTVRYGGIQTTRWAIPSLN